MSGSIYPACQGNGKHKKVFEHLLLFTPKGKNDGHN
jgi:hypothetical protein